MKRYRLKIPEMIRREDAKMADKLDGHSVVTSNSFGSDMFIQETQCSCKREWLEEIKICKVCGSTLSGKEFFDPEMCADCWNHKDEPMSAEELIKNTGLVEYDMGGTPKDVLLYQKLIDLCAAVDVENEKKYRLQQTFEDFMNSTGVYMSQSRVESARAAWIAHAKATNTEAR